MNKKLITIIGSIIGSIVLVVSISLLCIRIESQKYNLISLDISNIPNPTNIVEDDFVQLSEIKMHYEKYGNSGKELILLHGNGGSCNTLRELATYLGNNYQVYLIESRCHGLSSSTDTISYEEMATDTYEFITTKGLDKPYFVGHSDGGMVGLALASMYNTSISALVSCGSNSNPKTFKLYFKAFVGINNLFSPSILNDLMLEQPNYTKEFLEKIKCPTLVVAAEHDIMFLSDTVFIYQSIPNAYISIIKDADHCSYIENDGKQGYALVTGYLNSLLKKQ